MKKVLHAAAAALLLALSVHDTAIAQSDALRDTIDREIKAAWSKEKIATPDRSTDSVFLRRIYLDLVGMIPTHDEAAAFLKDTDPKKREKLIDKLLADPRYARQQAQIWDIALLGRNPKGVASRSRENFRKWLATQFQNNEPYDRIVAKLLTAEEEGARLFYVPIGGSANDMTTAVTRLFLGKQLQCAQCHDHPFEPWTQKDYYGMAGFFVRTTVVETEPAPNQKVFVIGEKSTGEVLFSLPTAEAKPGAKKGGDPVKPKFLGGAELSEPALPKDFAEPKLKAKEAPPKPVFSRREKIVEWITAKENPYFARAVANRVWAQFMGRGFVHPVDDFTEKIPASHPTLLKAIEASLVAGKFDLKWLIREIVSSDAYQVTDVGEEKAALPELYNRAPVRPLSVEELVASLHVATGVDVEAAMKAAPSEQMLKYFGEPTDGRGVFQSTLAEHLFFHNGDTYRGLCQPRKGNLAETLLKSTDAWEAKADRMFLSILSRLPTDAERQRFVGYLNVPVKDPKDPKESKLPAQRLEESIWVLVSCSEFRFNR